MIDGVWLIVAGLWAVGVLVPQVGDVIAHITSWLEVDDPESTAVDEVHQLYLDDEIDEDDLEERLEILVDDRARTIQDLADDEHGIGEEISRKVAREFDTVGEFVAADAADLEAIEDVGPERAERLARIDPK